MASTRDNSIGSNGFLAAFPPSSFDTVFFNDPCPPGVREVITETTSCKNLLPEE